MPTIRPLAGALLALGCLGTAALAQPALHTEAPRAVVMDFATGRVLLDRNADQPTAPASLAKLMTAEILFGRLKRGETRLDDVFTVSEQAQRSARGAILGLKGGAQVRVGDLMKGLIVQSANDAAVVLAEGIAGTVPAFAALMNRRADDLGLKTLRFANPHGLPERGQSVTLREMALLATHLIRSYPEFYPLFAERDFAFEGRTYRNRNPLLDDGADGLKTGQTAEAGFALVASAARDGRRIVIAINGLKSAQEREKEARRLLAASFQMPVP